jgi:hypothetical protein
MNTRQTRPALTAARDAYFEARERYVTARQCCPTTPEHLRDYRRIRAAAIAARRTLRAAAAAHFAAITR